MYYIGIDMGGTGIKIGLVEDAKLLEAAGIPTVQETAEECIERIAQTIQELLAKNQVSMEQISSIGMGVPGIANLENGRLEYANNLCFSDVPILLHLKQKFRKPVYFDNDANAAAWGQYLMEKSTADSYVMLTLGTGIGCGMILNGRMLYGVNYGAGEVGHMTLKYDGIPCNCGRRGCFEAYASASALVARVREAMQEHRESVLWELCEQDSEKLDGRKFFRAVELGDQTALAERDRYVEYLAQGITNLINILQPQELRIGGGISKAGRWFLEDVRNKVARYCYSRDCTRNTNIQAAPDFNEAGIVGAAMLEKGQA